MKGREPQIAQITQMNKIFNLRNLRNLRFPYLPSGYVLRFA